MPPSPVSDPVPVVRWIIIVITIMRLRICLLALTMVAFSACSVSAQANAPDVSKRKLNVVTTTSMITDLVKNVGGEHIALTGLFGPGVDPHEHQPTEADGQKVDKADLVFYNGLHLEAQMDKVFKELGAKAVPVSRSIPEKDLRKAAEIEGGHDPHIWFDVRLWMKACETVRDTLAERDPAHAKEYQENAKKYLAELEKLNAYVKEQSAKVPKGKRVLVTAHDAFFYFGNAYDFEVKGLQGISTEAKPSINDVNELAAFIAERQIPAVFVESSVPEKNIKAVQDAVAAKGYKVGIGGTLFSDALGDPDKPEGTYIGMVKHNVNTIVEGLTTEPKLDAESNHFRTFAIIGGVVLLLGLTLVIVRRLR